MKKKLLLIILLLVGFTGCSNNEKKLEKHENYKWISKYNENDVVYFKVIDLYTSYPGGVNKVYYTEDEKNIEYLFEFLDCNISLEELPNRYSPPRTFKYIIYMKDGKNYSFTIRDGYLYYYNEEEENVDKKSNYFNSSIKLEFNQLTVGECIYSFNNIRNPVVYINDEKIEEYIGLENLEFVMYDGEIEGNVIKKIIGDDHIIDVYPNGIFTFRYKIYDSGINYQLVNGEF